MGTTLSQDIAITDHVVNVAITRDDPNSTLGPNVTFNVAFPEDVINVDAADFVVVTRLRLLPASSVRLKLQTS